MIAHDFLSYMTHTTTPLNFSSRASRREVYGPSATIRQAAWFCLRQSAEYS